MRKRIATLALSAAVILLTAAVPARSSIETVEVALVSVDLWIADADGRPRVDVEADDLELLVAGGPWPIASLDFTAAPSDSDDSTWLAIYVDTAFLRGGELRSVIQPLVTFLAETVPPSTLVMLAVADPVLHIEQPFSAPRPEIQATLEALAGTPVQSQLDKELAELQRDFERIMERAAGGAMPFVPGVNADALLSRIGSYAAEVDSRLKQSVAQLEFLLTSLRGLPGRKDILYLTGRPPFQSGVALLTAWQSEIGLNPIFPQTAESLVGSGPGAASSASGSGLSDSSVFGSASAPLIDLNAGRAWELTAQRSAGDGISIYPFDVGSSTAKSAGFSRERSGVSVNTAGSGLLSRPGADPNQLSRKFLAELAELTGGSVIGSHGDTAEGLAHWFDRNAQRYRLTFEPSREHFDETLPIEIRFRDRQIEAQLDYRRFLRVRSRDQITAESVQSAMLVGEGRNPLEIHLEANLAESDSRPDAQVARLRIEVPFSHIALQPDGSTHLGQLSVFSVAGNLRHDAGPVGFGRLPLRIANSDLMTALGRWVEYSWEIELTGPADHVAIAVRDDLVDLTAVVLAKLEPTADE